MNAQIVLAIDIGTSSTRTALFDTGAERLEGTTSQQTYPLITSSDGGAELDPPVLLGAVWHCLEQTMRAYRANPALRDRPIAAIGVSCFWHSLVGCDAQGSAMTRIFTWAETRCREDAAQLRKEFSEKETHARTGCMLNPLPRADGSPRSFPS
jgi:gluconokinase